MAVGRAGRRGAAPAPTGTPAAAITGFSIDTRTLQPGDVFVALKAERDGHDFVPARSRPGPRRRWCRATMRAAPSDGALLRVADPLDGLAASAAPRARAATRASSPSRAAPARPAPRRCCGSAWRRRPDARLGEVLQQPLGRAADAGAHAARRRIRRVRDRHEPRRRDHAADALVRPHVDGHHHGRAGAPGILRLGRGHRRGQGGDLLRPGARRHGRAPCDNPHFALLKARAAAAWARAIVSFGYARGRRRPLHPGRHGCARARR